MKTNVNKVAGIIKFHFGKNIQRGCCLQLINDDSGLNTFFSRQ
mgnify:CR=1 FL=1